MNQHTNPNTRSTRRRRTSQLVAVAGLLAGLASCSFVENEVAREATYELATDVEHRVELDSDESGRPTTDVDVLRSALRAVVVAEWQHDNGSFRPTYSGLDDDDGDGLDDDGSVEIEVRDSVSCVHVAGTKADVSTGPC